MYFYRARQYEAKTGRFLQKDPIGFSAGDVNVYRYVGNSPANYVDPNGLVNMNLFHKKNDRVRYSSAENYGYVDGVYTVGGHGNEDFMTDANGNPLSPDRLSSRIKKDPNWQDGMPVQLLSCKTGKGKNSFAERLAKIMGVPVLAPDDRAWYYPDGSVVAAGTSSTPNTRGEPLPGTPAKWRWFR